MADAPLRGYNGRHEWFWEPGDEEHIFPMEHLMDIYEKSVGRNATLIMGLTPDPDGLMPESDVKRLAEWGVEIRRKYGTPLATNSGVGYKIEINLKKPQRVDRVIIQEEIAFGERIRKYRIEAKVKGKWKVIGSGESVGNKRIQGVEAIQASKIRLIVEEALAEPRIKGFSVFGVD